MGFFLSDYVVFFFARKKKPAVLRPATEPVLSGHGDKKEGKKKERKKDLGAHGDAVYARGMQE
jgi:hypothetical protein